MQDIKHQGFEDCKGTIGLHKSQKQHVLSYFLEDEAIKQHKAFFSSTLQHGRNFYAHDKFSGALFSSSSLINDVPK